MNDEELIKSMLSEIESYGFISRSNLHNEDGRGLVLIEKALKRMLPLETKENTYTYNIHCADDVFKGQSTQIFCPCCMKQIGHKGDPPNFCEFCGQAVKVVK